MSRKDISGGKGHVGASAGAEEGRNVGGGADRSGWKHLRNDGGQLVK